MLGITEEGNEGSRNEGSVKYLKNKAATTHAELEGGDGVVHATAEVRAPLDVEANQESASAAVAAEDIREPGMDFGGVGGEEGEDGVGVKGDVVEVAV